MSNTDDQTANGVSGTKGTSSEATRATRLREVLTPNSGATIAQIRQACVWQPHTARAVVFSLREAGAVIERTDTLTGPVYRIVREDATK